MPTLYVEGAADVGVINALLGRHGLDTHRGNQHLFIKSLGSDVELLNGMLDIARTATDQPVGFVLDIDGLCQDRWRSVCDRLKPSDAAAFRVNLNLPAVCPADGYIGVNEDYGQSVGVWLMPDCVTNLQKLEDLCRTLVPAGDPLWDHAVESSRTAVELFAKTAPGVVPAPRPFSEPDTIKANIHTWLAWQREPGLPLGAAINARYFGHDSPQAVAFLRWIKRLYLLEQLQVLDY